MKKGRQFKGQIPELKKALAMPLKERAAAYITPTVQLNGRSGRTFVLFKKDIEDYRNRASALRLRHKESPRDDKN